MALSLHIVAPGTPCNLRAEECLSVWVGASAIADTATPTAAGEWAPQCVKTIPEGLYASKSEWDLLVPFCTNCYTKCWVCSLLSGCLRMVPSCWVKCTSGLSPDQWKGILQRCGLPVNPFMCNGDTGHKFTGNQALLALVLLEQHVACLLKAIVQPKMYGKLEFYSSIYHIYLPSFYSVIHNCFLPVFWT